MNVYLAAPYTSFAIQWARDFAEQLRAYNISTVSTWHRLELQEPTKFNLYFAASAGLDELMRAHAVIVTDPFCSTSGGLWVELGYALAAGKPVLPLVPKYSLVPEHVRTLAMLAHLMCGGSNGYI